MEQAISEGAKVWFVALAGLLHDIGKLGQRAGEIVTQGRKDHASIGDAFVQRYVPEPWQGKLAPVGWHHGDPEHPERPLDPPVKIVALADRLSAGERIRPSCPSCRSAASRIAPETFRCPKCGREFQQELPPQLIPVFDRLNKAPSPRFFPLTPLQLEERAVFPGSPLPTHEQTRGYEQLWNGLVQEATALQQLHRGEDRDLPTYLESMLALLQKYTWCVPSAFYYDLPDVSLFDHLRTTAALAAALTQSLGQNVEAIDALLGAVREDTWPAEPQVAGLLAGDLSGIQSFLYHVHDPKGAASILRARSFYLQMLNEAIARWILRELELPATNVLYVGGGTFTLVVPPALSLPVEKLACQINEVLFRVHRGALYMALAHVPLAPRDFQAEKLDGDRTQLAQRMRELHEQLARQKATRFSELPVQILKEELFAPQGQGGGEERVCSVCGAEATKLTVEEETRWCLQCEAFRQLGRDLRRAEFLLLREVTPLPLPSEPTWIDVLRAFGADAKVTEEPPPWDDSRSVLFLLTEKTPEEVKPQTRRAIARKFLVNTVPLCQAGEVIPSQYASEVAAGEIKHFGILARQSQGAPYLGVLRMDADNLGRLFSQGLGEHHTLSRYASLSFLLSLFFEGWVGERAARMSTASQRLYAVYSGGDDLFFAGSWDAVVELAQKVRADFEEFVGSQNLGLSGGLVLIHEKYPVYLAAKRAGDAEDQAKGLRVEKDAISFLGVPVGWEQFGTDSQGNTVTGWAKRLAGLVEKEDAPRAVVRRIQDLYFMYATGRTLRGEWGPWIWRGAYWLARACERAKLAEVKAAIKDMMDLLAGENFGKNIGWLALAARWAELATRKEGAR